MEKKTIKEWLETLDEPYRSQALENVIYPNVEVKNVIAALYGGFHFGETPKNQGMEYWNTLVDAIVEKECKKQWEEDKKRRAEEKATKFGERYGTLK